MKDETKIWLDYQPDAEICNQCIKIAERVEHSVKKILTEKAVG